MTIMQIFWTIFFSVVGFIGLFVYFYIVCTGFIIYRNKIIEIYKNKKYLKCFWYGFLLFSSFFWKVGIDIIKGLTGY